MKKRIGIATYPEQLAGTPSDRLFFPLLAEAEMTAVPVDWHDPTIDWTAFDGIIVRVDKLFLSKCIGKVRQEN